MCGVAGRGCPVCGTRGRRPSACGGSEALRAVVSHRVGDWEVVVVGRMEKKNDETARTDVFRFNANALSLCDLRSCPAELGAGMRPPQLRSDIPQGSVPNYYSVSKH